MRATEEMRADERTKNHGQEFQCLVLHQRRGRPQTSTAYKRLTHTSRGSLIGNFPRSWYLGPMGVELLRNGEEGMVG